MKSTIVIKCPKLFDRALQSHASKRSLGLLAFEEKWEPFVEHLVALIG